MNDHHETCGICHSAMCPHIVARALADVPLGPLRFKPPTADDLRRIGEMVAKELGTDPRILTAVYDPDAQAVNITIAHEYPLVIEVGADDRGPERA